MNDKSFVKRDVTAATSPLRTESVTVHLHPRPEHNGASEPCVHASVRADQRCGPIAKVRILNPLQDPRWNEFIGWHPRASIFHTTAWLEALRKTYKYEPFVVTTAQNHEALSNGIVLCQVRSWLSGSRLVSVPFSDHCEPLVDNAQELERLVDSLKQAVTTGTSTYLELRPLGPVSSTVTQTRRMTREDKYCVQSIDLHPNQDEIFRSFHKSCVQRKIRRAARAGLLYEEGCSEELISKFYQLLLITRRRHHLPPQPISWFRNLAACLGDSMKVRVVSKDSQPAAAIITIQFRDIMTYKYGCSDADYHNLGGIFLLMWRAILDAKSSGALTFDMGRSSLDNQGLASFKEHWGATRTPLPYYRYPSVNTDVQSKWKRWLVHNASSYLPDPFFEMLGSFLYKHIG